MVYLSRFFPTLPGGKSSIKHNNHSYFFKPFANSDPPFLSGNLINYLAHCQAPVPKKTKRLMLKEDKS